VVGDMVYENSRGIRGWWEIKGKNFEKLLFILHRLSGVVVGLYFILHIFETSTILNGEEDWKSLMEFLKNPFAHTGLLIVAFLSVFHALNGIRLIFAEQGLLIGKMRRQGYPIVSFSLTGIQRKMGWFVILLTFILALYAFYHLFIVSLGVRF